MTHRTIDPERFAMLSMAAIADRRITHAQFRTLSALLLHADRDGKCYPKMDTLSSLLGKSDEMVRKDIDALIEYGYVSKKQRFNTSNEYTIRRIEENPTAESFNGKRSGKAGRKFGTQNLRPQVQLGMTSQVQLGMTSQVQLGTNIPYNIPQNRPLLASVESSPSAVSIPPSSEIETPSRLSLEEPALAEEHAIESSGDEDYWASKRENDSAPKKWKKQYKQQNLPEGV